MHHPRASVADDGLGKALASDIDQWSKVIAKVAK